MTENEIGTRVIEVVRERTIKGVTRASHTYYIASLPSNDAARFAHGIRGHWAIENQLHWVKDVHMREERCGIAGHYGVENLSVLKNIALNLIRRLWGSSVKNANIYYAANVEVLCAIFRT